MAVALVEKGCTIDNDYCEERDYGYGCEGCRYYDWKIIEILHE